MNRALVIACIAFSTLPLAACGEDDYRYGMSLGWRSYPSYGWYDGYYGTVSDGYWGNDGYFWYRNSATGRYRRGSHDHFRRNNDRPADSDRRWHHDHDQDHDRYR